VNFAITNDEHPMASLVASALRVFFALLRFGFSGTRNKARLYLSDVSKFRRLANITTGIPSRPMWWSYMIGAKFLAIACEIIKLEPGKFYASTIESSTTGGSTVQRQEVQRQEVQRQEVQRHRRFNDSRFNDIFNDRKFNDRRFNGSMVLGTFTQTNILVSLDFAPSTSLEVSPHQPFGIVCDHLPLREGGLARSDLSIGTQDRPTQ
jgi:hypothetical protein